MEGQLNCTCSSFPIEGGIPRFVPHDNYSKNFGFQWKKFRRTQLDSYVGLPISRDRFYAQSQWSPAEIRGKLVLDIGCGAGRFTEVVLDAGAIVMSLDYSDAVDACFENHRANPNFMIVQGDIYHFPFSPNVFDYVFCFGVLQHTPDPHAAFMQLTRQLKPGAKIAIDSYRWRLTNFLEPKYWLRPITTKIPQDRLLSMVRKVVPVLLPPALAMERVPAVGRYLTRLLPIAVRSSAAKDRQHALELSILDTFDWYGPAYDQPQTPETLHSWFEEAGLSDVSIDQPGHLTGRGRAALR